MRETEKESQSAPEHAPEGEAPTVRRPVPDQGSAATWVASGSQQDDSPAAFPPGQTLAGRYTILGQLGQGGMGIVLAAYDARLDRRVRLHGKGLGERLTYLEGRM